MKWAPLWLDVIEGSILGHWILSDLIKRQLGKPSELCELLDVFTAYKRKAKEEILDSLMHWGVSCAKRTPPPSRNKREKLTKWFSSGSGCAPCPPDQHKSLPRLHYSHWRSKPKCTLTGKCNSQKCLLSSRQLWGGLEMWRQHEGMASSV